MAGIPEPRPNAFGRINPCVIGNRTEGPERSFGVGDRIDRCHFRTAALRVAAVEVLNLEFLNMTGIRQHAGEKIDSAVGRIDRALEPVLHQLRNQARVIDMRMSEKHEIDFGRFEGEVRIVERLQRLRALKHAAIDQEARLACLQQVAGSGDGVGGAVNAQGDRHYFCFSFSISISSCNAPARRLASEIALVGCGTEVDDHMARAPAALMRASTSASKSA